MKKLLALLAPLELLASSVVAVEVSTGWSSGHLSIQGRRRYQEDRLLALSNLLADDGDTRLGVFAIFDGHIGSQASEFLVQNFEPKLRANLQGSLDASSSKIDAGVVKAALEKTIAELESLFLKEAYKNRWPAGSTACVAVVTDEFMVVANVGDSRAIACVRDGGEKLVAKALTSDHHPELPAEQHRIEAAGGVVRFGVIDGHFPMSRAIGDLPLKNHGVIATPDVSVWTNTNKDGFIVLASDGLYEGMSEQEVCDIAAMVDPTTSELGQAVANQAVRKASELSRDNISIVVIPLNQ